MDHLEGYMIKHLKGREEGDLEKPKPTKRKKRAKRTNKDS